MKYNVLHHTNKEGIKMAAPTLDSQVQLASLRTHINDSFDMYSLGSITKLQLFVRIIKPTVSLRDLFFSNNELDTYSN